MSHGGLAIEHSLRRTGRLLGVSGRICANVDAALGELVQVQTNAGNLLAEVIGFDENEVQLMPFRSSGNFRRGDMVEASGGSMQIGVGNALLGRVLNALGEPIDGKGDLSVLEKLSIDFSPPDPLTRRHIEKQFVTGIKAIDGMLTMGQGQRVGLFAGSGVGKSTLLGEIAKYSESDVNVVAMIGERGREVRPFIEECLGERGLERSIVIVSTSDEPPLARIRASEIAVIIASWFRSQGSNVLLLLDSLTRLSQAQRELGLLLGEPPTSRGYTPSVFQKMSRLLEQMGTSDTGSVTGLLTVLVDGDDMNEPIADAARSILDGHIVLDRKLAVQNHFPAISVLESISRLFNELADDEQKEQVAKIRGLLAKYREVEDLLQIGAYKRGASAQVDQAVDRLPMVNAFLRQALNEPRNSGELKQEMSKVASLIRAA
ncbi:MAG: FliI/YscN family ATPase [Pirellulaceae bacterium]